MVDHRFGLWLSILILTLICFSLSLLGLWHKCQLIVNDNQFVLEVFRLYVCVCVSVMHSTDKYYSYVLKIL